MYLRYARVDEKDLRTIQIPIEPVAKVLGCAVEEIDHLRYVKPRASRHSRMVQLNGHPLWIRHVHLRTTPICVDCVLEHGYVSAYWHLSDAVACPSHGRRGLGSCPVCRHTISWFRKGLLRCQCGYRFDHAPAREPVDPQILPFLEILRRRTVREPITSDVPELSDTGYPIEDMAGMPLSGIVTVVWRLRELAREHGYIPATGQSFHEDMNAYPIAVANDVFRDWPRGFHRFIECISASDPEYPTAIYSLHVPFGIRGRHAGIWESLFTETQAHELAFMKRAIVEYGVDHWKSGPIDRRLTARYFDGDRLGGLGALSRRLGVQPSTARRLIESGKIEAVVHRSPKAVRYTCRLDNLTLWKPAAGASYRDRRAANFVGLPVKVLRELRARGLFNFECLGKKTESYHEIDVKRLKDRLWTVDARAPEQPETHGDAVSLAEVMRWKLGSPAIKAEIVGAVLSGAITPVANGGTGVDTILLDREDVQRLTRGQRARLTGQRLPTEAAAMLRCDHTTVRYLLENGNLVGSQSGRRRYVDEDSLARFADRYVSTAWAAQTLNTNSKRLRRLCDEAQLELLAVPRPHHDAPQTFIPRDALARLGITDLPRFYSLQDLHGPVAEGSDPGPDSDSNRAGQNCP